MAAEVNETFPSNEKSNRTGSDKYRLQQMRSDLIDKLDDTETNRLCDVLFSKGIFTPAESNKVTYEKLPEEKLRKLLDILEDKVDTRKDPPVLDLVVNFLRGRDGELADRLMKADGIPEWVSEAEETLRIAEGMDLTDQVLSVVVRNVGSSWKNVAHQLNITEVAIENITYDTRDPYEQKFQVFNNWKKKSGYLPRGLIVLLNAIKDNDGQCRVDWPKISDSLKSIKNK